MNNYKASPKSPVNDSLSREMNYLLVPLLVTFISRTKGTIFVLYKLFLLTYQVELCFLAISDFFVAFIMWPCFNDVTSGGERL